MAVRASAAASAARDQQQQGEQAGRGGEGPAAAVTVVGVGVGLAVDGGVGVGVLAALGEQREADRVLDRVAGAIDDGDGEVVVAGRGVRQREIEADANVWPKKVSLSCSSRSIR